MRKGFASPTPMPTSAATPTQVPTSVPATVTTATAAATPARSSTPGSTPVASPTSTPVLGGDVTIAAAGDVACAPGSTVTPINCHQQQTSDLLVQGHYAAVLAVGDTQYNAGLLSEFMGAYDPSWGRVKSATHPVVGNHEYVTTGASGYFSYFGATAGSPAQGYYSFNIGAWHIIALNSNCAQLSGGCAVGSPEETWLRSDLAAYPHTCTLAYYHHPRFSSGDKGDHVELGAFWTDLYNAHAALAISGHDHDYERFAPQNASGGLDAANGVREFVVGTGGEDHALFYRMPEANTEVRNDSTFGILQLTLHASSYDWRFVPEAGAPFSDAGSGSCPAAAAPTPTLTSTATGTPVATATSTSLATPTATMSGSPVARGTLLAQDSFAGRSMSGGWGTASDGLPWTLQLGMASQLAVSGSEGLVHGTGSSPFQVLTLGSTAASNEEVVARYSTSVFTDDVGRLLLRFSNAQTFYAAGIGSPSSAPDLEVTRTIGGVMSRLCSVPFSASAGTHYWERVQVQTSGTAAIISAKAWADGTAEPATWQVSCTDSSPLAAGLTGVDGWDGGVSWSMDSFSAGNLG